MKPLRWAKITGTSCLTGILLLILPPVPEAAVIRVSPLIRLRSEYNDNINFSASPDAVIGSIVAPRLEFEILQDELELNGVLSSRVSRYANIDSERELGTTDYTLGLTPVYRMESGWLKLNTRFVRDSTLNSELLQTGLVLTRRQRTSVMITPIWSWSITERSSLELQYRFSKVDYSGGQAVGLFDFEGKQATASLSYQLTEKSWINTVLSASEYNIPSLDFTEKTVSGRLGMSYLFSDTAKTSLLVGENRLSRKGGGRVRRGLFLSGSGEKRFEKTVFSAQVRRDISPSGSGSLLESDMLSFSMNRRLMQRLSGTISASIYQNRFLSENVSTQKTRYNQVQVALSWHWQEHWLIAPSYRYSRQKREGEQQEIATNVAEITLEYRFPKLVFAP